MVDDLLVAHPVTGTRLRQQVRRIAHAFHAAGCHDVVRTRRQQVVGKHRRFHARSAHLVDGSAAGRQRQSRSERGLSRWRLALSGREHAAHDDFLHLLRLHARALHRRTDGRGTQLRRREVFQFPLQRSHRRARDRNYHDRIVCHYYLQYSIKINLPQRSQRKTNAENKEQLVHRGNTFSTKLGFHFL